MNCGTLRGSHKYRDALVLEKFGLLPTTCLCPYYRVTKMVSLAQVQASNRLIRTVLPAGLVAVFVGATSGIGEISVKTFAKYANKPRIYLVGRSQDAADRILGDCKALNPEGTFAFIKADVSLIRAVDELCRKLRTQERAINLLFLSAGVPSLDRSSMVSHTSRSKSTH